MNEQKLCTDVGCTGCMVNKWYEICFAHIYVQVEYSGTWKNESMYRYLCTGWMVHEWWKSWRKYFCWNYYYRFLASNSGKEFWMTRERERERESLRVFSFGLLPQGYCERKTPKSWKKTTYSVLSVIINPCLKRN